MGRLIVLGIVTVALAYAGAPTVWVAIALLAVSIGWIESDLYLLRGEAAKREMEASFDTNRARNLESDVSVIRRELEQALSLVRNLEEEVDCLRQASTPRRAGPWST